MKSITVVIAAGAAEARLVVKTYSPVSRSGFVVAADIPAALVFEHHQLKFFHLSDFLPRRTTSDDGLAFRLVTSFLNHPPIKSALTIGHLCYAPAIAETLRHRTQTQLIEIYNLIQLCQRTHVHKLIIGQAFPPTTISLVKRQLRLKTETLTVPPSAWWERLTRQLERSTHFWWEIIELLINHPLTALRAVYFWLKPHTLPSSATIMIFSNGLDVANYKSLISSLRTRHSVAVVTDPPTLLDRFYLAKYQFDVNSVTFSASEKIIPLRRQFRRRLNQLAKLSPIPHDLPVWITRKTWKVLLAHQLQTFSDAWITNFQAKFSTARLLLSQLKPKLLITTHEPGPTAIAFVLAAKQYHLPTLLLLHGPPTKNLSFYSDRHLIWGPALKKFLQNHISGSRLITGGQPIFAHYRHFFISQKLSPIVHSPIIGIFTAWYGTNTPHQLGYLLDLLPLLAKIRPRPHIYLRTHPHQYFDGLSDYASQLSLNIRINPPQTIEEFISSCHLIITQTSTAAIIAGLSRKPVVYFPAFHPLINQGSLWHYRPFFATTTATQAAQLTRELLNRPLSRQEIIRQQDFLRRFCGRLDASCGPKLADTINKLYFSK